ncbi:mannose-1-phosphate guanylyltransferase [Pyrrhoderma noxium]|uniref:Mannose-1-phosphate guanylyltransferase n=1 Tax=Pyrrhoderma noxium TaxID=2282107 RepID=A0A286UUL5_9AGAM|nr:mannose-1-phosphate guanylyltransferase [Pyrrhoderma noxium]
MSFSSATIDVGMNGYRHGHPRPLRHHQHHHPQQTSTSNVKNVFDAHDENDKKGKSVGDYSAFGFGAGFGAGVGTGNESRNVGIEDEFPTSVEYMFEKIMDTVSKSNTEIEELRQECSDLWVANSNLEKMVKDYSTSGDGKKGIEIDADMLLHKSDYVLSYESML